MEVLLYSSTQRNSFENTERHAAVSKLIGARFLWDAICGRPFAAMIDTRLIVGEDLAKFVQMKAELKEYERRLQNRSPVVIGHNILMDLCFLHSSFVEPLPESLQEFRALTRDRLPRIVDTKYLFMRGGDEMSPDYSLGECFADVRNQKLPVVAPDPSYGYPKPCPHQAGYDSK